MCRDAVVHVRLVVPMIQLIQWQASKQASDGRRLGSARRRFSVIFGPVSCLSVCCSGGRTITSRVSTPPRVDYTCSFVLLIVVCAGFATS